MVFFYQKQFYSKKHTKSIKKVFHPLFFTYVKPEIEIDSNLIITYFIKKPLLAQYKCLATISRMEHNQTQPHPALN